MFENCIATIVHQVDTIGRMISEFSAFARMPAPVFEEHELDSLVERTVALQRAAWPQLRFACIFEVPRPLSVLCDAGKIGQALTNLLKNAAEALSESPPPDGGRILVRLRADEAQVAIEVEDNGPGLPDGEPHRLFDPYVTTKQRGSGLGLAIVRKIMEEHEGRVELHDGPQGGAIARLTFPRRLGLRSA